MSNITKEDVINVLREVYDPEIPVVNIVDLGLIYDIKIENNVVYIKMTLTAPGCPLAGLIVDYIKNIVKEKIREVKDVQVEIVWDPPWTPERMSPKARKLLGFEK